MASNSITLWQARILGGGAILVGVGISRMAFTPLAALAVSQGLWPTNAPSKIGAFLLVGYAAGAVVAPWLLRKLGASQLLQLGLLFSTTCLILESVYQKNVGVWLLTRSIFGFFGACLMVCGPIVALSVGTSRERHNTQIWTFSGIGLGACLSASMLELRAELINLLVPIMLFCLLLFLVSILWFKMRTKLEAKHNFLRFSLPLPLIVAYGLYAIAYIPATVYLSDYVSNELGLPVGNKLWQLFGLGAILSPWLATTLSKKIGSPITLNITYILQTLAFLVLAFSKQIELLAIGSTITGACVPAVVLLTAAELRRTLKTNYFPSAWSFATLVFACAQSAGAIIFALCFQLIETYQPIFWAGTLLLIPACYLALKHSKSVS
ncbi:MAG: YbfB/YjiJ family MFS transporter [Moorea sp. SIOASIH]|uniref:YbfB/YjiJ family MFS transporter n=1 Tax=Moorena sp. SIOASIH TaxID=2607817 RepID=UPI0013B98E1E|nr:YbfB/YjiJ family MFS transporter [Moorena sp. SIOASIH]NEO41277.1 YbfB/YjiJ family MFS transporter [Moorena sp. SIOASIH]